MDSTDVTILVLGVSILGTVALWFTMTPKSVFLLALSYFVTAIGFMLYRQNLWPSLPPMRPMELLLLSFPFAFAYTSVTKLAQLVLRR